LIIVLAVYVTSVSALKVAFLIPGCTSDLGWNYNILQAVLATRTKFASSGVVIVYQESVTVDGCVAAANAQIANGTDMIFFPTGSFETCAKTVATANPTKFFVTQNGGALYPDIPNLATDVKGGVFQARFIVGALAAAQLAKNNKKVCFMVPKTYGSNIRWSNAIFLGMRNMTGSDKTLLVGFTNDFNHPPSEEKVIKHFKKENCGVVIQHQDSLHPQLWANRLNMLGIGWGSDMSFFIKDNVLTSIVTDWTFVFNYYIQKVIAGTFQSERYNESLAGGQLRIAPYSKLVTKNAAKIADYFKNLLTPPDANPFCGPPVKAKYGTDCTTEANLIAEFLSTKKKDISVYDGTV